MTNYTYTYIEKKFCNLALLLFVNLLSIDIISGQGVAENEYWSQVAKIPMFQKKCNFNESGKLLDIAINSNNVILGFTPHIPPRHDVVHWCEDDINVLVRSTDYGKSWSDITKSLPDVVALKAPDIRKVPLYRTFWYWHLNIDYILVDGIDFYIITYAEPYTNDDLLGHNYIYKSSDDGLTWQYLTSTLYDATVIVNKGIIYAYNSEFDNTFSYKKQSLMKWYPGQDIWLETDYLVGPYREYRQYKTDNGIRKEFKQGHYEEIDLSLVELASFDGGKTFQEEFRVNEDNEISYDKGMNWSKSIYEKLYHHSMFYFQDNSLMPHLSTNIKKCGNYIFNIVRKGENWYVVRTDYLGANIEYLWKYDSIPMPYLSSHMDRDGYIYTVKNNILYKSNYQFNCEEDRTGPTKQKDRVYGTTIITHGINLGPLDDQKLFWNDRMAIEILRKAGAGVVYRYDPETGAFNTMIDMSNGKPIGEREDILIFDWSAESIVKLEGITESAANALYLSLAKMNKGKFGLDNLHFIGHGRGCVVNSLVVSKMLINEPEGSFSIDQVTNLDPYAYEEDQILHNPKASVIANSVIPWNQTTSGEDLHIYYDTYYQDNGFQLSDDVINYIVNDLEDILLSSIKRYSNLIDLGGLVNKGSQIGALMRKALTENSNGDITNEILVELQELSGYIPAYQYKLLVKLVLNTIYFSHNYFNSNLNSDLIEGTNNFHAPSNNGKIIVHDNTMSSMNVKTMCITDYYENSITNSSSSTNFGYCRSRLAGSEEVHRSYFQGSKLQSSNLRSEIIQNGLFTVSNMTWLNDVILPGWEFHGGYRSTDQAIFFDDNKLAIFPPTSNDEFVIQSNRFYLPYDASLIMMEYNISSTMPETNIDTIIVTLDFIDASINKVVSGNQLEIYSSNLSNEFKKIKMKIDPEAKGKSLNFKVKFEPKNKTKRVIPPIIEVNQIQVER